MQKEFKNINQETICAANKVAERMLKELQKTKPYYQQSRELYFACLEFFSILHDKEINDEFAIEIFYRTEQLLEEKYLKLEEDCPVINIFWNAIITSNADGEECNIEEFLKNLRMKFGEKAEIVLRLTNIVEKMYPNCNSIKSQTYKFDFISFRKQTTIQFSGRISKEQINEMFEYIKDERCENFACMIKYYLDQHHLEYSNFEEKLTKIKIFEFLKIGILLLLFQIFIQDETIKNFVYMAYKEKKNITGNMVISIDKISIITIVCSSVLFLLFLCIIVCVL